MKEDHRAAIAQVTLPICARTQKTTAASTKLHFADLHSLDFGMLEHHCFPWTLDAHTHAKLLQDEVTAKLQKSSVCPHRQPKKATISAATWELVQQKKTLRNHLCGAEQQYSKLLCAKIFAAWARRPTALQAFEHQQRDLDKHIAIARLDLRQLGHHVTKALRQDDRRFFEHLMREGQDYLRPHQSKSLWQIIRRSLPKMQQRRKHLNPFQHERLEDQWEPYFQQLKAGHPTSPAELVQHYLARTEATRKNPVELSLKDLPTLIDLEDTFRKTSAGKSTGLDPLPAEIYKARAATMAKIHYQLILKLFTWQTEPLAWKGGLLHVIPKKPHSQEVHHFRGIMLMGTLTKRVHSLLRQRTIQVLLPHRTPGQLGGFPGQQVLFGQQALRTFAHIAHRHSLSSGVIFLDLKNAFHKLIREQVTGIAWDDDFNYVLEAVRTSNQPTACLQAGRQLPAILARLGAPRSLINFLQDIHSETWFKLHCPRFQKLAHEMRNTTRKSISRCHLSCCYGTIWPTA